MIPGVNLNENEQLGLIIEYTSKDPKRLAQSLRNAYINNLGAGLKKVWKKLGERFGLNAVITQVRFEKMKKFPSIATRYNKRLKDFGDLLLELKATKNHGTLTAFKILDEPNYLQPLASKTPEDLPGNMAEARLEVQVTSHGQLTTVLGIFQLRTGHFKRKERPMPVNRTPRETHA